MSKTPRLFGGVLRRQLLRAAGVFESRIAEKLEAAAQSVASEPARVLFRRLAEEERLHETRLTTAAETQEPQNSAQDAAVRDPPLPDGSPTTDEQTLRWLAEIEQAERALAEFYRALAEKAAVPEVARLFEELAGAEDEHLRQLAQLRESLKPGGNQCVPGPS